MQPSMSMPKLPDTPKDPLTFKIASTELWQKGQESVTYGSRLIFHCIMKALKDGEGALIGRHGTIELTTLLQAWQDPSLIDAERCTILEQNAGIFPRTGPSIATWIRQYGDAVESADCMATAWYKPLAAAEWRHLDSVNPTSLRIPLRSLEPYYCAPIDRWTRALEGQRVCVVSSFAETMQQQVTLADAIWKEDWETLLPSTTTWSFVRSYYSPVTAKGFCAWPAGIESWKDAVDDLESRILATKSKIVLLGCGGLAMPLAHRLKEQGCVAIVMGGAIQVLFGIQGRRWANHPVISGFWNAAWCSPSPSEIPGGASAIEGGCYW